MNTIARILGALPMFLIMLAMGCDSDDGKLVQKEADDTLSFMESSEGLPATGQWRHSLCFYDMNGDGYLDIVAPPPRKASKKERRPTVWYQTQKGTWQKGRLEVPSNIGYDYGAIDAGDFTGDGETDLVLGMHGQKMRFLRGAGNGKYADFSRGIPSAKAFSSRAVVSADFDQDGVLEFAAVSEAPFGKKTPSPGLRVFDFQEDQWKWHPAVDEKTQKGLYADQLVLGDVNGDGNKDIGLATLVHYRNLVIWIGDGNGNFTPFNEGLLKEKTYLSVALADLNEDGRDDLIASITGFGIKGFRGLKAFLSRPEGFEEISDGLPQNELFVSICAGDVDQDERVEVAGVTADGGVKVYRYDEGGWSEVHTSGLPDKGLVKTYNMYCVDINADGCKDIVVNYAKHADDSGGIRVFLAKPCSKGTNKK